MDPFRSRDGRQIVDQVCFCWHAQSEQGHRLAELPETLVGVPGHRPCPEGDCPCQRFSFKDFVYEEKNE